LIDTFQGELVLQCEAVRATQTTAFDKLAGCLKICVTSLQQNIQMFPLTLELWAAASSGLARARFAVAMENLYREFRGMTAGLIETGKANGEFCADVNSEAVAAWLVGGRDGMMLQYWFDQSLDVQGWTENFLMLVWRGITADT
jgi:hypothetical protein